MNTESQSCPVCCQDAEVRTNWNEVMRCDCSRCGVFLVEHSQKFVILRNPAGGLCPRFRTAATTPALSAGHSLKTGCWAEADWRDPTTGLLVIQPDMVGR